VTDPLNNARAVRTPVTRSGERPTGPGPVGRDVVAPGSKDWKAWVKAIPAGNSNDPTKHDLWARFPFLGEDEIRAELGDAAAADPTPEGGTRAASVNPRSIAAGGWAGARGRLAPPARFCMDSEAVVDSNNN